MLTKLPQHLQDKDCIIRQKYTTQTLQILYRQL